MITIESQDEGRILSIGLDRLARNPIDSRLLSEIGEFVKFTIKVRTAKGLNVNGAAFDSYSAKWSLVRTKRGLPINKVDLFFSGGMMASMTHKVGVNSVEIFFLNSHEALKAHGHHFGTSRGLPARPFFALSKNEIEQIKQMITDALRLN
jgi:hypothetical protein